MKRLFFFVAIPRPVKSRSSRQNWPKRTPRQDASEFLPHHYQFPRVPQETLLNARHSQNSTKEPKKEGARAREVKRKIRCPPFRSFTNEPVVSFAGDYLRTSSLLKSENNKTLLAEAALIVDDERPGLLSER